MAVTGVRGPYIPRADGALRDWLENFAAVVGRSPSALGVTEAEAAALGEAARRYAEAYAAARAPGSRGRVSVARKNAVRRAAWDLARPIAMRIKRDAAVSDAQKVELGVYPPLRGQSRIRAPRTRPLLELVEMGKGWHRLRYRDAGRPSRFAKPYGAVAMVLYVVVGKEEAASPVGARRVEQVTRHVFEVRFTPGESGKRATYFGRWVTRRGLMGPCSRRVSAVIA